MHSLCCLLPAACCGLAAGSVDAGALPAGVTLNETTSAAATASEVVPALANTGANDATVPATIAGSVVVMVLGSLLVIRRQRRKATV